MINEDSILRQQIEYYRARASEYDEWILRLGRYDRGEEHRKKWFAELEHVRQALASALPGGDVLELACLLRRRWLRRNSRHGRGDRW